MKIFFDITASLKLLGMLKGILKEFIDQSHPIFPILFSCIGSIKLLKLRIVGGKIFLGDSFIENYFLELVILDFDPKVVLSFWRNTLQEFIYSF